MSQEVDSIVGQCRTGSSWRSPSVGGARSRKLPPPITLAGMPRIRVSSVLNSNFLKGSKPPRPSLREGRIYRNPQYPTVSKPLSSALSTCELPYISARCRNKKSVPPLFREDTVCIDMCLKT